jgi:hypothetical protein
MALTDHIPPREAIRADLKERLTAAVNADVVKINTIDDDGHPHWSDVPVITIAALSGAMRQIFEGPLPAASERAAEVHTPATVFVSAECPRCHIPARIPLTVGVELHQDETRETLHLKASAKAALHVCGQLGLDDDEDSPMRQRSFGLDDIVGPVPSAEVLRDLLAPVISEIPTEHQPNLERTAFASTYEAWTDLEKREVAAWAAAVHLAASDNDVAVPPLPVVLGGEAPAEVPTAEQIDEALAHVDEGILERLNLTLDEDPTFEAIAAWDDATKREVLLWTEQLAAIVKGGNWNATKLPPTPAILGGPPAAESPNEELLPD